MKTTTRKPTKVNTNNHGSLFGELFLFEGRAVRVVGTPEEPLFVAQDVCDALDLKSHRERVARLEPEEKGVTNCDSLGGSQNTLVVTESGLYALVFSSHKPEAVRFRRWVTSEVLPALRKHGFYQREGLDARLPRVERARVLRSRRDSLLAEARALGPQIALLEELGGDACTVGEALGEAGVERHLLSAITRCLAFARRNHTPVGRRGGRMTMPRAAIRAALDLDQGALPLGELRRMEGAR